MMLHRDVAIVHSLLLRKSVHPLVSAEHRAGTAISSAFKHARHGTPEAAHVRLTSDQDYRMLLGNNSTNSTGWSMTSSKSSLICRHHHRNRRCGPAGGKLYPAMIDGSVRSSVAVLYEYDFRRRGSHSDDSIYVNSIPTLTE